MKRITKIIIPVILLIGFQNVFGQNNEVEIPESTKMYRAIANSGYDLIVRINWDMNDEDLRFRIGVLTSFDAAIKIDYSRDESGNIKTLTCTNSGSSCMSDNFGFLIIGFEDGRATGCMISDKE